MTHSGDPDREATRRSDPAPTGEAERRAASGGRITRDRFDAILFDLDGVLTKTAVVHFGAWKRMFDSYLHDQARRRHARFVPFSALDYERFVDGRPRYDGVRSFLTSRHIRLPEGGADDEQPGIGTVRALGDWKDRLVHEILATHGVDRWPDGVRLLRRARERGLRTAVVSSSRNCHAVLVAAGIEEDVDVVVDGEVAERLRLAGKPAPDTFLEAARRLEVSPERAVVVEDALAGVEAGRAGGFGLVVGADRAGHAHELRAHGADVAISDLSSLLT